jgi:four helix bundle protein
VKNVERNVIYNKSFSFALEIVELYKYLCFHKKEYVLSKQLLRSGTGIGANISEGLYAQSRKDFVSKMHIALKEASETEYWINLLLKSNIVDLTKVENLTKEIGEIIKILSSIISTSKETLSEKNA